jgi:hypothetical protein
MTAITITKSLLQMMPDIAASVDKAEMNGVDIKKLSAKLDQIDIFASENTASMDRMRKVNAELYDASLIIHPATEVLMRIKTLESHVVFYGHKDSKDMFKSFVMFVDSDNECVLIHLAGEFTVGDIKQVIDNNTKTKGKGSSDKNK